MRKLLVLLFAFAMCGCVQSIGSSKLGKRVAVPIEKGSTRFTITNDYIIVETCKGNNSFENPFWECDRIINNDSTLQELICKIKE